jgi:hypothetical protein
MVSRYLLVVSAVGLAIIALTRPAFSQTFRDEPVQAPELKPPGRGSLQGAYADLAYSVDDVVRGTYQIPAPIAVPAQRGRLLFDPFPRYSPGHGLSEWGMGWSQNLEVKRHRVVGDLDYATDSFLSPWGRLVETEDGEYLPEGLSTTVRLTRDVNGWTAYAADGAVLVFDAAVTRPKGTYSWHLSQVTAPDGGLTTFTYETNDSGRLFLKTVLYGGPGHTEDYRIEIAYEPSALAKNGPPSLEKTDPRVDHGS